MARSLLAVAHAQSLGPCYFSGVLNRLCGIFGVCALAIALCAQGAFAQDAKHHFERGVELSEQSRWAEALQQFRLSFELVESDTTLFNIAVAEEETGAWVDALRNYQRLLKRGQLSRDHLGHAVQRQRELAQKIPRLHIRVANLGPRDVVRVDTVRVDISDAVPVNPGQRSVEVLRAGTVAAAKRVRARVSETVSVLFELPATPSVNIAPRVVEQPGSPGVRTEPIGPLANEQRAEDGGGSVFSEWWFWTVVGVVVIGAGVGVGLALSADDECSGCVDAP